MGSVSELVWRPVLERRRDVARRETGIGEYVDGEGEVHAFLGAHLSVLDVFLVHREHQLNKGYGDRYLKPLVARSRARGSAACLRSSTGSGASPWAQSVVAERCGSLRKVFGRDPQAYAHTLSLFVQCTAYGAWTRRRRC